jgi:regulator of sirC expression with transglutaminase-like and TPR domain
MDFPTARQRFYQETRQSDAQISLAKAALYIAQEEYPELDVEVYLTRLNLMATEIADRLPATSYPLRIIQTINQYLFTSLGFQGNTGDYYDPRNSYLNQVIDRRTGIPITLSLVYLELAQRIGFPMEGVGLPGHFLIRPVVDEMQVFVDPFNQGEILFEEDCRNRLQQIFNRPVELRPEFLAAVSPAQFLTRMLSNLKAIYISRNEISKALTVIDRILLLVQSPVDQRDRGILYYQSGRWTEASRDLESYLNQVPTAGDAAAIRGLLKRIQESEE